MVMAGLTVLSFQANLPQHPPLHASYMRVEGLTFGDPHRPTTRGRDWDGDGDGGLSQVAGLPLPPSHGIPEKDGVAKRPPPMRTKWLGCLKSVP